MLKGKLKDEFELFYDNNFIDNFHSQSYCEFCELPFEMQKGVYEAFFIDKFNVFARLGQDEDDNKYYYKTRTKNLLLLTGTHKTPNEAYKEWLSDMNELYNDGDLKKQ